jgi:hypothetical protein
VIEEAPLKWQLGRVGPLCVENRTNNLPDENFILNVWCIGSAWFPATTRHATVWLAIRPRRPFRLPRGRTWRGGLWLPTKQAHSVICIFLHSAMVPIVCFFIYLKNVSEHVISFFKKASDNTKNWKAQLAEGDNWKSQTNNGTNPLEKHLPKLKDLRWWMASQRRKDSKAQLACDWRVDWLLLFELGCDHQT